MSTRKLDPALPRKRAALPTTRKKGDPCPDCGEPRYSPLWATGGGGKKLIYYRCNDCINAYAQERRAAKRG